MTTKEERLAEVARQEAYRASPAAIAARSARLAAGLCVIESDVCIVHNTVADFDHYLATRPAADNGHNPRTGIAYND